MSNTVVRAGSPHTARPPRIMVWIAAGERAAIFPPSTTATLEELGEVIWADPASVSDRDDLDRVDIAVVAWGSPTLDAQLLARMPRLTLVVNAASSVRAFVSDAFWARRVPLTQAGAAMSPAVAEMSLAMTLTLLRRLHRMDHALRSGAPWAQARAIPRAREIAGSRIGVVGASRTGREYIRLCRSLGAGVRVYDPYLSPTDPLAELTMPLDELVAASDVLALHAPATAETAGMITSAHIAALPEGSAVVNTARSTLLDMDALFSAASAGRIDVALDVYDDEPLPEDDRWRMLPNVLLSGHVSGATRESRERAGRIVADEIGRFLAGRPLDHAVTAADLARMG